MEFKRLFSIFLLLGFFLPACSSENNPVDSTHPTSEEYVPNENEVAYEAYIAEIDSDDSLGIGNSLFYSKGNSEFTEVEFYVNDKGEMVKMIESYTQASQTVAKNIFYLKKGRKFASKELYEVNKNGEFSFVERVTYYDDKEKPLVTKERVAPFEQDLDFESFKSAKKQDCSMQRALDILDQKGEFNTTYQGYVKEGGFTYIIVGGVEADGYTSSLLVQYEDATIKKLMANEKAMIGTPLIVDFQVVEDAGEGFEYQILRSIALRWCAILFMSVPSSH